MKTVLINANGLTPSIACNNPESCCPNDMQKIDQLNEGRVPEFGNNHDSEQDQRSLNDNEKPPKVIAVTLNWNGKDDTIECLNSLLKMDYAGLEVVIVDNASIDGSVNALKSIFPKVSIIENSSNLGYALGYNKGIEYALERDAKYIFILNNDTVVDKHALMELVKIAESNMEIGFVSGKVYHYSDPNKLQVIGKEVNFITGISKNIGADQIDNGQYEDIMEYQFLDDVFWLVRSDVFKTVGMYDPNFFLQFEETDLCARANKHFKLVYTPCAKIWHKGSSSGGGFKNPIHTYYLARNRIVFMRRNAALAQFIVFLLFFILVRTPITITVELAQFRYSSAMAHITGIISGIKWAMETRRIRSRNR